MYLPCLQDDLIYVMTKHESNYNIDRTKYHNIIRSVIHYLVKIVHNV